MVNNEVGRNGVRVGQRCSIVILKKQEDHKLAEKSTVLATYFSLVNFWAHSRGQFRVIAAMLSQFLDAPLQIPSSVFSPWPSSAFYYTYHF